eukprot:244375-Alexandrium_andersonii.AAC.1
MESTLFGFLGVVAVGSPFACCSSAVSFLPASAAAGEASALAASPSFPSPAFASATAVAPTVASSGVAPSTAAG